MSIYWSLSAAGYTHTRKPTLSVKSQRIADRSRNAEQTRFWLDTGILQCICMYIYRYNSISYAGLSVTGLRIYIPRHEILRYIYTLINTHNCRHLAYCSRTFPLVHYERILREKPQMTKRAYFKFNSIARWKNIF